MGVGYQASALHRIVILVVEENAPYTLERPKNSPLPPMPNVRYMRDPARFRSPDATDIIAWRDRLAIKYRSQFEELLSWDETSAYSQDIEIGVGVDVLLRYVAARIVEAGPSALRDLVGVVKPERSEIHRAGERNSVGFQRAFPAIAARPDVLAAVSTRHDCRRAGLARRVQSVRIKFSARGRIAGHNDVHRRGRSARHAMDGRKNGRAGQDALGRLAGRRRDRPRLRGGQRASFAALDDGLAPPIRLPVTARGNAGYGPGNSVSILPLA